LEIEWAERVSWLISMMKSAMKKLGGWGIVIPTIISLSGCAIVSVDSLGNRTHFGLMWVKQGTADKGQANVVIIKTVGVESGICPTGFGLMLGYKKHLYAWTIPSNDSSSNQDRAEFSIDASSNGGRLKFMSVTVPAHPGASLFESSQIGANLSTCSDCPLLGMGYWNRRKIQYDRNGKAYSLKYLSGKPAELLFHEIDPNVFSHNGPKDRQLLFVNKSIKKSN
jgi:hypothetical protein